MGRIRLNRSFRLILLNSTSVCIDYACYIGVIADRHPHTDIQRTKNKNKITRFSSLQPYIHTIMEVLRIVEIDLQGIAGDRPP